MLTRWQRKIGFPKREDGQEKHFKESVCRPRRRYKVMSIQYVLLAYCQSRVGGSPGKHKMVSLPLRRAGHQLDDDCRTPARVRGLNELPLKW